ncbi:dehydrogenase/reductase SDR family member 7B-like isoform X2 [Gordionus sp. m RMFG-2023]|uniref:dehydrogenase/reductase SDR family member 7B-like isoform X2 n=1 Tax=Gordionus sp. m RMFG-2023 TaxID=3053472 RepID=UPI0031FBE1A0
MLFFFLLLIFLLIIMYIYKKYKFIENLNKQYPFPSYFYGKTIVITGANSGLGEALSFLSAKYGAKVVMSGRNMENLEKARQKIIANLPDLIFVPTLCILDVSDPKSIFNFTQEFVRIFDESSPDILINNAGISYRGEISNTEISVHRLLMETNYFGPLQLIKGFLPYMIEKRYGVIVNICSLQGKLAIPFRSAYSASKHALQAYTDCLRAELSKYNIFISLVNPGYINTKLSFNAITYDGALYNNKDNLVKCVIAESSESLSTAGDIDSPYRRSLFPENLEALIFIKKI